MLSPFLSLLGLSDFLTLLGVKSFKEKDDRRMEQGFWSTEAVVNYHRGKRCPGQHSFISRTEMDLKVSPT